MFGFFKKSPQASELELMTLFKEKYMGIQNSFVESQKGFDAPERSYLEKETTEEMFRFFMDNIRDNITNGVKNVINIVDFLNIFTVDTFYDDDVDSPSYRQFFHTVRIQVNMQDYYVNKANEIVEGNDEPMYVEETWVFTRMDNSTHWVLASIEDDGIEGEAV